MGAYFITDDCVGCTLCAKNCPVKAISGSLKEKHTIDPNICIGCGACCRVCAKGAILNDKGEKTARVAKTEWPKPAFNKATCAGCSVCVANCPKGCLEITEPRYGGDIRTIAALARPEDCLGCGICEGACPIGAIKMVKPGERPVFIDTTTKTGGNIMSKIYCRAFQFVFKLAMYVMNFDMPQYIEGPGAVKKVPEFIREKCGADFNNVLVVTDPGLWGLKLPQGLLDSLDAAGFKYSVFYDIERNPTSNDVEKGLKVYKENGCQGIVAFGGGAPMDTAKAIGARLARPNKTCVQMQGTMKVLKKIPPLFTIPTTAGTGSETTVAAVITDSETHHKRAIQDPVIMPPYAILDPELTVGLPPFVTATTGMDALCHAVEAYTNHTYNTKLEDKLAKDAVKLVYENLLTAYKDGSNLEARQNMQKAAFFAGRAFTRGCVGYVHAVGHQLGGLYGTPHGLAMSVILPHVMRQFGPAVYDKLADLADVCGMEGADNKEKAEKFIAWIEQLKVDMDLPYGIDNIKEEDIEQIISWAMTEGNPTYPVPVIWGRDDFRKLIATLRG